MPVIPSDTEEASSKLSSMAIQPSPLVHIANDVRVRVRKVVSNAQHTLVGALTLLPAVLAQTEDVGYVELNSPDPSYAHFKAGPVDNTTSDGRTVLADMNNFLGSADWSSFSERLNAIRASGKREDCIGNLSMALSGVGAAYQASASGATTLLTLLPTAGALIGTPVKELWVLYKLMPLAGLFSMVLSLGGNIIPSDVNDYERVAADALTYSGMIATRPEEKYAAAPGDDAENDAIDDVDDDEKQARSFARDVAQRARDPSGSKKTGVIALGIILQLFWLGLIMSACWFMQSGAVVVWWCTFYPWMYFWYGFVALSSLLENLAGVPFTRQWTIRVSRAPKVEISPDAPWVIPEPDLSSAQRHPSEVQLAGGKAPTSYADEVAASSQFTTSHHSQGEFVVPNHRRTYSMLPQQPFERGQILRKLERGYNTFGKIVIDANKPWSAANNVFIVIISVRGVSNPHAILRVFSKLLSIGVYTVGTAMFASSTLETILVAVIVASLIIVAGVFGRVTAMWMASELMKNKPIMHKVAKDPADAERYIEAMLRKPNIVYEILGHIITDGRCIKRYSRPVRWSNILGVLAPAYDLTRLATTSHSKV